MSSTLEERIDRLESVEAIIRLKHEYMEYCDQGYVPNEIGSLFTEDGVWTNDFFGHYEGREAIIGHFANVSGTIVFAAHLALNPIIEVNGDVATGKWRMLMPFTNVEDGEKVSRLMLGDYDETYQRVDGVWKFSRMDFFINFDTPFDQSWVGLEKIRP